MYTKSSFFSSFSPQFLKVSFKHCFSCAFFICSTFDVIFKRKREINQELKSMKNTCQVVHSMLAVGLELYKFVSYFSRILLKLWVTSYCLSVLIISFLMFYQVFFLPQVKGCAIITYKHAIYKFHLDVKKLGNIRKVSKLHGMIA